MCTHECPGPFKTGAAMLLQGLQGFARIGRARLPIWTDGTDSGHGTPSIRSHTTWGAIWISDASLQGPLCATQCRNPQGCAGCGDLVRIAASPCIHFEGNSCAKSTVALRSRDRCVADATEKNGCN